MKMSFVNRFKTPKRKFTIGQVWKYRTRKQDSESHLIIINNLGFSDPDLGDGFYCMADMIKVSELLKTGDPHREFTFPIWEKPLRESVTRFVKTIDALPSAGKEGCDGWLKMCEEGDPVGLFILPVAEIIDKIEMTVSHGDPVE